MFNEKSVFTGIMLKNSIGLNMNTIPVIIISVYVFKLD